MAKDEAKEEGAAASKHKTVVYADIRKRKLTPWVLLGFCVALILVGIGTTYTAINTQNPRFTLDDLYIDPVSNSSVLAKLSSKNPNHKTGIYYSKISVHVWIPMYYSKISAYVWIPGGFETERVFLESTNQEPREVTTWTAVVASNNDDNDKPHGTFQIRNGEINGYVLADLSLRWKGWILPTKRLHVRCPVILNLKDLTSSVPKPMSSCSTS